MAPADALKSLIDAIPLSVFEDIRHRDADRYWKLADAIDVARVALGENAGNHRQNDEFGKIPDSCPDFS